MTTGETPWTTDPETGMRRTTHEAFGAWLARRRAETGITTITRNSGKRRTASKKALLKAIEDAGGKW
jgi:hypothetical protein